MNTPYEAGLDCGLNGANTTNCHFTIFCTKEKMQEWERGKRAGDAERLARQAVAKLKDVK